MAQETLNGLLQYILLTLPLEDKKWFAQQLEADILKHGSAEDGYSTPEELKQRLLSAYQDAEEGRVYSQEEAHRLMDEIVKKHVPVAV